MKKYLSYILILFVVISFFIFKSATYASVANPNEPCNNPTNPTNQPCINNSYHFLAPLPDPTANNKLQTDFDPTQTSSLSDYLNIMLKLFIGICAVLAVIMIVIGGMEYMTSELMETKTQGKKRIEGAIFGLLLALAAYAILYTINPDLLKSDIGGSLTQTTITIGVDTPQTPMTNAQGQAVYSNGGSSAVAGTPWDNTIGVLATLPTGVTEKQGTECTYVGQQNCTSIRGLITTNAQVAQQACNCNVIISGGTEYWLHEKGTSHGPNSPTVDLRADNGALDATLSGGKPLVNRQRYGGALNAMYETEGDPHWHIGT